MVRQAPKGKKQSKGDEPRDLVTAEAMQKGKYTCRVSRLQTKKASGSAENDAAPPSPHAWLGYRVEYGRSSRGETNMGLWAVGR